MHLRRDERGLGTVETVFVVPVLFFAIAACFQVASYLHGQRMAQAAAEDGAAAARAAAGTAEVGRAVALDTLTQLGGKAIHDAEVTATRDAEVARVEVRGRAPGPVFDLPVRAVSGGSIEAFRPEARP